MKIYLKQGNKNYKEKRMITEIENVIAEMSAKDPNFESTITPANTFHELTKLHEKLCIKDADYEEVKDGDPDKGSESDKVEDADSTGADEPANKPTIDPFNDAEPIVRDYVLKEGFEHGDIAKDSSNTKTSFEEPDSFASSFELPNDNQEQGGKSNNKQSSLGGGGNNGGKQNTPPINPQFNEMDNGKKKRSTKKFAKMIVDAVCILAEKGCIWWTTKDITEDKLVQYELEDTMDLQLLLTLDTNQQITVRKWFSQKVVDAQTLFKVEKQDQEDLVDSLAEVMLEKGIAPTPMQELMINAIKTFVLDMGLKAYALSAEINNVLAQLKGMKAEEQTATDMSYQNADPIKSASAPIQEPDVSPVDNDEVLSMELQTV
jgi:hypothetical protein